MDEFRKLLQDRLRERGALAQLAKASGLNSPVIGHWARGETRPSPINLQRLAPALGIPYEDLLKMCGYLPGAPAAEVDARRQVVRNQLDEWMNAVGPENEPYFWEYLKTHGDSAVDLIRLVRTAVNAEGDTAVNSGVSGRAKRGRKPRTTGNSPLTDGQLATDALMGGHMRAAGQHRAMAVSRRAA